MAVWAFLHLQGAGATSLVQGLLTAMASPVAEHKLPGMQALAVVIPGL